VRGPLSALRQLGGEPLARMCGVALGAGEHGLAFIADGPAAVAAACVALRVEPALAARVRVAGAASSPVESALCEAFGLASLVDGAADAAAALAALRRACGG
jgi:nicotinate-nucleotide--dimethylbenzimidazole phosphoribosyltransferase